jgi:hypothetical protein
MLREANDGEQRRGRGHQDWHCTCAGSTGHKEELDDGGQGMVQAGFGFFSQRLGLTYLLPCLAEQDHENEKGEEEMEEVGGGVETRRRERSKGMSFGLGKVLLSVVSEEAGIGWDGIGLDWTGT